MKKETSLPLIIIAIILLIGFILVYGIPFFLALAPHSKVFNPQYSLPDHCSFHVIGVHCRNDTVEVEENTIKVPLESALDVVEIRSLQSIFNTCIVEDFSIHDLKNVTIQQPLPKDQPLFLTITCSNKIKYPFHERFNVTYVIKGRPKISHGTLEIIKN